MKTIKQANAGSFSLSFVMKTYFSDYTGHFFSRDTLRFFRSRIGKLAYIGNDTEPSLTFYFLTSEKKCFDDFRRVWTIRKITRNDNGILIDKVGEFGGFESKAQAFNALREIL